MKNSCDQILYFINDFKNKYSILLLSYNPKKIYTSKKGNMFVAQTLFFDINYYNLQLKNKI